MYVVSSVRTASEGNSMPSQTSGFLFGVVLEKTCNTQNRADTAYVMENLNASTAWPYFFINGHPMLS